MPKRLDQTILGLQYKRARAYVDRTLGKDFVRTQQGHWYAPMVEAYVAGAKSQRAKRRR